jgi:hypothetical protein
MMMIVTNLFHSPHGKRERKNTKSAVEDQNNEKKLELRLFVEIKSANMCMDNSMKNECCR